MKILLINPPFKAKYGRFSRSSRSPAITKSGTLYYPIWLAYCTGVLENEGFDVKLIDAPAEEISSKKIFEYARSFNPDLIVIDTSTPSIYNDVEFAGHLKLILPKSFVILVGTHPSALPKETLQLNKNVDAVAIGEYDFTIKELAFALKEGKELKNIRGIAYREKDIIIINERREYIENLDSIPFVSSVYKKHLNYKNYFESMAQYPMIMILTGRGCPFKCFFCVYPQVFSGNYYRLRSAENVVAEFEYILENFPDVKEIGIEDDTFSANIKRVREICFLLIKKGLHKKINWYANTRINLDFETMKLMKAAGCRLIIPGIESGVQSLLNNMHKGIRLEQTIKFVENAKKARLLVHGCFMIGVPGETRKTILETIKFSKQLKLDTAQFYPLIPYPGTEAYFWALKNNFLISQNYSYWLTEEGLHNAIISLPGLQPKDLVSFCNYARKSFYLRPKYILYKMKQSLLNFEEMKRNYLSFRIFAKYLFKR